jgi:hypothetical protein
MRAGYIPRLARSGGDADDVQESKSPGERHASFVEKPTVDRAGYEGGGILGRRTKAIRRCREGNIGEGRATRRCQACSHAKLEVQTSHRGRTVLCPRRRVPAGGGHDAHDRTCRGCDVPARDADERKGRGEHGAAQHRRSGELLRLTRLLDTPLGGRLVGAPAMQKGCESYR